MVHLYPLEKAEADIWDVSRGHDKDHTELAGRALIGIVGAQVCVQRADTNLGSGQWLLNPYEQSKFNRR